MFRKTRLVVVGVHLVVVGSKVEDGREGGKGESERKGGKGGGVGSGSEPSHHFSIVSWSWWDGWGL